MDALVLSFRRREIDRVHGPRRPFAENAKISRQRRVDLTSGVDSDGNDIGRATLSPAIVTKLSRSGAKGRRELCASRPNHPKESPMQPSSTVLPFQRLDVYVAAKEFVRLVHDARIRDRELCDQASRAAKSMFLQLAEGLPQRGIPMRRKYFSESSGSLCEVVAAVDLARTIDSIDDDHADAIQSLGYRIKGMLWKLGR